MSLFSNLYSNPNPQEQPPNHPIWNNFMLLFLTNFKLIPFFVPSIICLVVLLLFGGIIFLAAGLLFLIPAGPAICAMYDISFQLVREVNRHERRTFFQSYRSNFLQGTVTMTILLPVIASLLMLMLIQTDKPLWVTICLILGSMILMMFSILAFSQIALVDLPSKSIWKNALLLIPLTHWRCFLGAAMHLIFLVALYRWIAVTVLLFLFAGPAVLICWTAKTLWPGLEPLLVHEEN